MDQVHLVAFSSAGELDQIRELAQGASLEIFQLDRGNMHGTLASVELGSSSIHSNSFNLSARGIGALSNDRWTFVAFAPNVDGSFNCRRLQARDLLLYRPAAEFEGTIHGAFHDWVFTIDDDTLRREVRRMSATEMPEFVDTCNPLRPRDKQIANLRNLAVTALSLAAATPQFFSNARFRNNLQKQLIGLLAEIVVGRDGVDQPLTRSAVSHAQVVRSSEQFLATRLHESVSIADLCHVTGVSIRTLRNAFQSVVGVSPKAYLKRRRLQLVRARLELATSDQDTVTSIAYQSGFFHLGNFSRDYRRYFCESPSTTLGRARVMTGGN